MFDFEDFNTWNSTALSSKSYFSDFMTLNSGFFHKPDCLEELSLGSYEVGIQRENCQKPVSRVGALVGD